MTQGIVRSNAALKSLPAVAIVLLTLLLAIIPFLSHAQGVSPPLVEVNTILRNSTQTKTVKVDKNPRDYGREVVFRTEVRGEYAHVITVAEEVVMPADVNSADIPFQVSPGDLANGDYKVTVIFTQFPEDQEAQPGEGEGAVSAVAAVAPGVAAVVAFTVTGEEVVDFFINFIQLRTTETDDPLVVEYSVHNRGNVTWKPDRIQFTFRDVDDETKTTSVTVDSANLPTVEPGRSQMIQLEVPAELEVGNYTAQAKFFYGGEEVANLNSQPFSVYPPDTLKQSGEVTEVTTNKTLYQPGENIRLQVNFKNTGEIRVQGVMITEVIQGDTIVDVIRGEELHIDSLSETVFSQIIQLEDPGQYTLSTYIEYGNKKTAAETVVVTIDGLASNRWMIYLALLLLVVVIFAATFFYLAVRRRTPPPRGGSGLSAPTAVASPTTMPPPVVTPTPPPPPPQAPSGSSTSPQPK
jgi:uncharacterized repeat protein (TIGR01451 family)